MIENGLFKYTGHFRLKLEESVTSLVLKDVFPLILPGTFDKTFSTSVKGGWVFSERAACGKSTGPAHLPGGGRREGAAACVSWEEPGLGGAPGGVDPAPHSSALRVGLRRPEACWIPWGLLTWLCLEGDQDCGRFPRVLSGLQGAQNSGRPRTPPCSQAPD